MSKRNLPVKEGGGPSIRVVYKLLETLSFFLFFFCIILLLLKIALEVFSGMDRLQGRSGTDSRVSIFLPCASLLDIFSLQEVVFHALNSIFQLSKSLCEVSSVYFPLCSLHYLFRVVNLVSLEPGQTRKVLGEKEKKTKFPFGILKIIRKENREGKWKERKN